MDCSVPLIFIPPPHPLLSSGVALLSVSTEYRLIP